MTDTADMPSIETERIVVLRDSRTAHLLAPEGVICGQSLTESHGHCHIFESDEFDPSWMRLCSRCQNQVTDHGDSPGIVRARIREALGEDLDGHKVPRGHFDYRELREILAIAGEVDE